MGPGVRRDDGKGCFDLSSAFVRAFLTRPAPPRKTRPRMTSLHTPLLDADTELAAATHDHVLIDAAAALGDGRLAVAEHALRTRLKARPTDIAAIRMLAEVAGRLGRYPDAEKLLRRALVLAPEFAAARANLATVLHRQNQPAEALGELATLLRAEPGHPGYLALKAAVLGRTGDYAEANAIYAAVLARHPDQPKLWMSYGHSLKTVGRQADSIAAYRRALADAPALGEVWWSLANLKTVRFSDDDIAAMQTALGGSIAPDDRYHLHFALGKALEDAADYAASFAHYAEGNRLRRAELRYDAGETTRHVERSIALLTAPAFAARAGQGCPAADPIFVVGLPRSGSTLIEQILASHSQVEGTMELPDITALARDLSGRRTRGGDDEDDAPGYLETLLAKSPRELAALGQSYLDRTRIQRKTGKPYFIDKMPNNWAHCGLIHLILPNAKIVDARRHPLATGFSGFKQHFARGQSFTYDLGEIGAYYRDYVTLMAHFDAVLPGRVHRARYEALVADPEGQIRALLAYCGLAFEAGCLNFHNNDRPVRTASSEQVRQPITSQSVDHWQHYDEWLTPLKQSLGFALDSESFVSQATDNKDTL